VPVGGRCWPLALSACQPHMRQHNGIRSSRLFNSREAKRYASELMEVGNQLRREIEPASEVISPFQHDGGG
jgi:hypothetical protein